MGDRGPIIFCSEKHKSNSTLEFHECLCRYDYSYYRSRSVTSLKIKHCHVAAEMMKMDNFYTYIIIGAVGIVIFVAVIAAVCSFKWYMETKKNPCTCCAVFCCCNRLKKRKRSQENHSVNVFEQNGTGHTWSPVSLPPSREGEAVPTTPTDESRDPSVCMNFCLSDPVQDCCEFFDCDIMWRKKSIYSIPIFGRKKQHFQRRPTRPAPLPPKAVVLPQVKNTDPVMYDDDECEPVPEAPPSPEPVRTLPAKAMYVDPLAFLQRTFAKNTQVEKEEPDDHDGKQEALYNKFKNMVLSKVKKSVSMASLNKLGISSNPNGISTNPSGSSCNKKLKTASLASLHNLDDADLDVSYGSKRSLSLASLHMLQEQGHCSIPALDDPRSRISVLSTVSTATDDIPPYARKDEYIDLEEMSKRIEAKMLAARSLGVSPVPCSQPPDDPSIRIVNTQASASYTPNFMPASAYINSSFQPIPVANIMKMPKAGPENFDVERVRQAHYYPPVPASQGRPAVPARTAVGSSIYSVSPSGTLGRPKPIVPPRPPTGDAARAPSSPLPSTTPRSPRLIKPSGPPPPPPGCNKTPIESSI